jgi:hypothetical protein
MSCPLVIPLLGRVRLLKRVSRDLVKWAGISALRNVADGGHLIRVALAAGRNTYET